MTARRKVPYLPPAQTGSRHGVLSHRLGSVRPQTRKAANPPTREAAKSQDREAARRVRGRESANPQARETARPQAREAANPRGVCKNLDAGAATPAKGNKKERQIMGIRIALAGNPNCGKTTMFNDLTGANQYVGNWPGVTVEKKEGKYKGDKDITVTDLPGIYSLSPYSPEEIVARDYLLDGDPDVVVNLVDATNLERNLYLTTQIVDTGLPVVIALNMMDLVEKNGDKIDVAKLSKKLGCPIVETSALKGRGMDELMKTAIEAAKKGIPAAPEVRYTDDIETSLAKIIDVLGTRVGTNVARWYAIKLLEGEERTINALKLSASDIKTIDAIRDALENELDDDAESIVTGARYDEITDLIDETVKKSTKGMNTTQKVDRIVTNRWLGLPIFVVIMFFVYWLAVSIGGGVVTDWANDGISGDGWLYTGGEAYEEAAGEYEDAQAQVKAYVENVLGVDEASDLPSE